MLKNGILEKWHVPVGKDQLAEALIESHRSWVMKNAGVTLFEDVTEVTYDSFSLYVLRPIEPAPVGTSAAWRYYLIGFMQEVDFEVYMGQVQALGDESNRLRTALDGLVLSSDHVEFDQFTLIRLLANPQ